MATPPAKLLAVRTTHAVPRTHPGLTQPLSEPCPRRDLPPLPDRVGMLCTLALATALPRKPDPVMELVLALLLRLDVCMGSVSWLLDSWVASHSCCDHGSHQLNLNAVPFPLPWRPGHLISIKSHLYLSPTNLYIGISDAIVNHILSNFSAIYSIANLFTCYHLDVLFFFSIA